MWPFKKKEENEIKEILEKILYVLMIDMRKFWPEDAKKILGKEIYEKINK